MWRGLTVRDPGRLAFITQTTLSVDDTAAVVAALKARFPAILGPGARGHLLRHHQPPGGGQGDRAEDRRSAGDRGAEFVEFPAAGRGRSARPAAAMRSWSSAPPISTGGRWRAIGAVGITAGASAPEVLVDEVIDAFRARYDVTVERGRDRRRGERRVQGAAGAARTGVSDARTQAVYHEKAADYAARQQGRRAPGLAAFIALMPAGAQVLDLGCGPGLDAGVMAAAGLKVLAVDAAPAMVAMAAGRPGVTARLAEFDEIATLGGGFAGVWASFSLCTRRGPTSAATCANFIRLPARRCPGAGHEAGQRRGTRPAGPVLQLLFRAGIAKRADRGGFRPGAARFGRGPGLSGEPSDLIVLTSRS